MAASRVTTNEDLYEPAVVPAVSARVVCHYLVRSKIFIVVPRLDPSAVAQSIW